MASAQWQIQHFSHSHPLSLTHLPNTPPHLCNACRLPAEGWIFRCHSCDFDLHPACSQIPLHPALSPHPTDGFICNFCSYGFSYQSHVHPFPCANLYTNPSLIAAPNASLSSWGSVPGGVPHGPANASRGIPVNPGVAYGAQAPRRRPTLWTALGVVRTAFTIGDVVCDVVDIADYFDI